MPTLLKEVGDETIRSRGFVWMKLKKGLIEFFFRDFFIHLDVIFLLNKFQNVF
jgi:hypothetical protein